MRPLMLLACTLVAGTGSAALAEGWVVAFPDVVTTKDGTVLEGSTARTASGELVVSTADGEVRLAASAVQSIVPGEGPRAKAEHALAAFDQGDADGPYRLAVTLESEGRPDLARLAYAAVIAVSPDHPAARRALGYERVDGAWVTVAEARRRNGLVLFQGRWVLPAELDRQARLDGAAKTRRSARISDAALARAMQVAATTDGALARAATLDVERASGGRRLVIVP